MLDKCRMLDYNKNTENEQMFGGGKIMNFSGTLLTILEVAMVAFAVWAVFHEDRFVAFEERLVSRFRRRRFKVINGNGNTVCKTCYPEKHRA